MKYKIYVIVYTTHEKMMDSTLWRPIAIGHLSVQVTLENCEILAFLGLNRHLKEAKGNSLFKVVT